MTQCGLNLPEKDQPNVQGSWVFVNDQLGQFSADVADMNLGRRQRSIRFMPGLVGGS